MFEQAVQVSEAMRQAAKLGAGALFPALSGCRICATAQMRLSGAVSWRDLGTSRRVIRTLGELGMQPGWLATLPQ